MDKLSLYRSLKRVIETLDEQRYELDYILFTLDTDITELEEGSDDFNLCFGGGFTIEMAIDTVKDLRRSLVIMRNAVKEQLTKAEVQE